MMKKSMFSRFCNDRDGIASIEFAVLLPFLLVLFFAAIEATEFHNTGDRVTRAANMLADLASLELEVTRDELDDMITGVENVVQPLNIEDLELRIVSVGLDNNDNPVVLWSRGSQTNASNGSKEPYTIGDPYTNLMNNNVLQPGFSVLVAEVDYVHDSPLTGRFLPDAIAFEVQRIRTPRVASRIGLCERMPNGDTFNCI